MIPKKEIRESYDRYLVLQQKLEVLGHDLTYFEKGQISILKWVINEKS